MLKKAIRVLRNRGVGELFIQANRRLDLGLIKPRGTATGRLCPRPFFMALINARGQVNVCCEGWNKVPLGYLSARHGLPELWNNRVARAFRSAMLSTELDRVCRTTTCPHILRGDLPRLVNGTPQPANPQALSLIDHELDYPAVRAAIERGSLQMDTLPQSVELSVDRRCNLYCSSCRSERITALPPQEEALLKLARANLERIAPTLQRLQMNGTGEVFFSPFTLALLRGLERTRYPLLAVAVLTNGLLLTPRTWERLGPGAGFINEIKVSIDAACPETYRLLRRGGDWERLMENMEFLRKLRRSGALRETAFNFVISAANFREMPDFVRLAQRFEVDQVVFSVIEPWLGMGTDYRQGAVHLPDHPDHGAFREILADPWLQLPQVLIGIDRGT